MENRVLLGNTASLLDPADMPIELRRTASSVTCKGKEIDSGREVALDIVTVCDLSPETREKIEVEAAAVKQLNHVNIPVLYDFGFDHHDVIYATEFFDGETAESWVTINGPMPAGARTAHRAASGECSDGGNVSVSNASRHPSRNISGCVWPDRGRRMAADQGAQFRPYPTGHAQVR